MANDVEVGWSAHANGHSGPTVYAEWINRGTDSYPQYYTSYHLNYDSYSYSFFVFNSGHQGIFRFKMSGDSSPFNYSPTMNFNQGMILTNSEHYNSCDTLYTEERNLNYFDSSGNWHYGYGDLKCYDVTSINDWLFNKIDNTDLKVDQNSGVTCQPS